MTQVVRNTPDQASVDHFGRQQTGDAGRLGDHEVEHLHHREPVREVVVRHVVVALQNSAHEILQTGQFDRVRELRFYQQTLHFECQHVLRIQESLRVDVQNVGEVALGFQAREQLIVNVHQGNPLQGRFEVERASVAEPVEFEVFDIFFELFQAIIEGNQIELSSIQMRFIQRVAQLVSEFVQMPLGFLHFEVVSQSQKILLLPSDFLNVSFDRFCGHYFFE